MIVLRLVAVLWQGFGLSAPVVNMPIVVANLSYLDMQGSNEEYWHVFVVRKADGSVRTKVVYGSFAEPSILSTTSVTTTSLIAMQEGHWIGTGTWKGQSVRWALDIKTSPPMPITLQPTAPSTTVHWVVKSNTGDAMLSETRSLPGENNFVLIMP